MASNYINNLSNTYQQSPSLQNQFATEQDYLDLFDDNQVTPAMAQAYVPVDVWAPDMKFAEEVIEECASFPYGDHDDLVDSTTQAVMRFRQGGFITHPEDEKEDFIPTPTIEYY